MYPFLSGPMVSTLFAWLSKDMVHTHEFVLLCDLGSGDRLRQDGCHDGGVYFFPWQPARFRRLFLTCDTFARCFFVSFPWLFRSFFVVFRGPRLVLGKFDAYMLALEMSSNLAAPNRKPQAI